ncbi:hypothetical protein ATANTOWER_007923 [Ataeniobius toweri]|uniref:Uncharacterized protein n=1 Tax=Ataeniobius toweri TaxID=208326 RepID=A0ABU7AEY1_9TELE|nr:hypothetical protein [Ataeniobius toweri]
MHFNPFISGILKWVTGELVPISNSLRRRGRVHPGHGHQSIAGEHRDIQPRTHPFTPKGNLEGLNMT